MIFSEVAYPHSQVLCLLFQLVKLEFGSVGFWGEGDKRVAREKSLRVKERLATTNPAHICRWHRDLNPSQVGGRQALSSLCHRHLLFIPHYMLFTNMHVFKKLVMWTSAEINESTCDPHGQMTNLRLGKKCMFIDWKKQNTKKKHKTNLDLTKNNQCLPWHYTLTYQKEEQEKTCWYLELKPVLECDSAPDHSRLHCYSFRLNENNCHYSLHVNYL